ncbi:MAG TPA: glycosyltransferase family 2 protein, partial [Longimicrobium sp.]|nr:glycosyltransferase family 2 protein [Longimicrobium sp.]
MIYICIPALNEARTVGVLLWRIRQVMDQFPRDYQILVCDDGSTDETPEVLAPYARVLPLTVIRHERTQGYAAALEKLIREAVHRSSHPKRDVLVTLQADFTESPDDIPGLLKKVEGGADVVGATVVGTEGELTRAHRWTRRGLPWLLSRAPLPREVRDPFSGFRAYRVAVLKRALQDRDGKPLLTRSGWAANAELLMAVAPHARRAEDAEVQMRYTRRERGTRFRPWGTLLDVWELARRARRLAPLAPASERGEKPAPKPA